MSAFLKGHAVAHMIRHTRNAVHGKKDNENWTRRDTIRDGLALSVAACVGGATAIMIARHYDLDADVCFEVFATCGIPPLHASAARILAFIF